MPSGLHLPQTSAWDPVSSKVPRDLDASTHSATPFQDFFVTHAKEKAKGLWVAEPGRAHWSPGEGLSDDLEQISEA